MKRCYEGKKLLNLLEGEVLVNWMELTDEEKMDYKVAKEELIRKMMPMGFVFLEEFQKRTILLGETVALYVPILVKAFAIASNARFI